MKTRRHGFTVMELTIVMLIVGILGAIAIPQYSASLSRYAAEAAAQRVVADLGLAQASGRTSSKNETTLFNVLQNTYQMAGVRNAEPAATTYLVDLNRPPYQARLVSVAFGNATQVTF